MSQVGKTDSSVGSSPVTALVALYRTDQITVHLGRALDGGLTTDEQIETITHLAFYTGWPNAITAITTLKTIIEQAEESPKTSA